MSKLGKRTVIIIGGILVLLIILAVVVIILMNRPANKAVTHAVNSSVSSGSQTVCSNNLISRADPIIAGTDNGALDTIATEVEGLKNYQADPNCLFIVLSDSLRDGNATSSQTYYTELKTQAGEAGGFSPLFVQSSPSLDTLGQEVAAVNANTSAFEQQEKTNSANLVGPN